MKRFYMINMIVLELLENEYVIIYYVRPYLRIFNDKNMRRSTLFQPIISQLSKRIEHILDYYACVNKIYFCAYDLNYLSNLFFK